MKTQLILSLILISITTSIAQQYKLNSKTVWFKTQGVNYTEGDFEKIRRFAEYILDHKLSFIELNDAKKDAEKSFKANPIGTLNEIAEIDGQMQQVYSLTDVQKVGLVRSALLLHVYDALLREPQMPLLGKLIDKHCKILAYDINNNLVFTQKDADGLYNLIDFIAKINGNFTSITANEKRQATKLLTDNFYTLNLEEKQLLAIMGIMNDYIQTVYNRANFTQKNQIKEELNKSFAASTPSTNTHQNSGVDYSRFNNMDARSYQMMSNMLMTSHVTSMNIISSIGGSGDYWYIKHN